MASDQLVLCRLTFALALAEGRGSCRRSIIFQDLRARCISADLASGLVLFPEGLLLGFCVVFMKSPPCHSFFGRMPGRWSECIYVEEKSTRALPLVAKSGAGNFVSNRSCRPCKYGCYEEHGVLKRSGIGKNDPMSFEWLPRNQAGIFHTALSLLETLNNRDRVGLYHPPASMLWLKPSIHVPVGFTPKSCRSPTRISSPLLLVTLPGLGQQG